jgi:hypothetical protein
VVAHDLNVRDLKVILFYEGILDQELQHVEDHWDDEHHTGHFELLVVSESSQSKSLQGHAFVGQRDHHAAEQKLRSSHDELHLDEIYSTTVTIKSQIKVC